MATEIDMGKAYDRLDWSFNKRILELNGSHLCFMSMIMHCIESVSS